MISNPHAVFFLVFSIAGVFLFHPADSFSGESRTIADQVRQPVRESIDIRRRTQVLEDEWTVEKHRRTAQYEALEHENRRLEQRAADLAGQVERHQNKIESGNNELNKIDELSNDLKPLLEQFVRELEQRIASDPPFLAQERRDRISRLKADMADPDFALGETFRRVMEAFLVEAEYGNTIEVYPETVPVNGGRMQARIFRMGRVSLFYRTPDGGFTGYYDVAAREWKPLPDRYARILEDAMEMASRQRPVELLSLPLGRMAIQ